MAQPAVLTIEQLCDAWMRATDADAAGEFADELAQRALDLGENETAAARCVCEAVCARLRRGGDEEDDEDDDEEKLAALFPAEGDTVEIVWQKDETLAVDGAGDRCIVASVRGPFPDKKKKRRSSTSLPAYHVYAELRSLVRLAGDQEHPFERVDETDRRPKHVHPKYKLSLHARGTVWRRVDVDVEEEDADDDEIASVLDSLACAMRGHAPLRRAAGKALVDEVPLALARPALREACSTFLLAYAHHGPAVRPIAKVLAAAADPAHLCPKLRALVAAFGPAVPPERCEIAERLGALLGGRFFERDWEARCVWRRADGSGGSRSCFGDDDDDEPEPPPAKRARRGEGYGPSLDEVEGLCAGRVAGAASIDGARGRGEVYTPLGIKCALPAENFALELLEDDSPPKDGVDFYRVGGSIVVLNADARWKICAQCRDTIQTKLRVACSVNLYATPAGATTLDAHADDHCVFVAQLSGAKRWRIFAGGEQYPDLGTAVPRPGEDAPFFDVTLHAGDVLYVPRGAPHVCRALAGAPSIHVSVGLDLDARLTWHGAVDAKVGQFLITFMEGEMASPAHVGRFVPALRRACLPALLAGDQDDAFAAGLAAALALAAHPPVGEATPAERLAAAAAENLRQRIWEDNLDRWQRMNGARDTLARLRAFAGAALEQSRAVTTLLRCKSL